MCLGVMFVRSPMCSLEQGEVKEEDDGGGTNKEGDPRDARHDKTRGIM